MTTNPVVTTKSIKVHSIGYTTLVCILKGIELGRAPYERFSFEMDDFKPSGKLFGKERQVVHIRFTSETNQTATMVNNTIDQLLPSLS